jgi:hypothetical protein
LGDAFADFDGKDDIEGYMARNFIFLGGSFGDEMFEIFARNTHIAENLGYFIVEALIFDFFAAVDIEE